MKLPEQAEAAKSLPCGGCNKAEVVLRPYVRADLPALAALFYDTVHRVNARDYPPEQLDAWADGRPDLERWDETLAAHDTLIAEADGTIVGFADMDGGYLDRLYVHASHQREGIAARLCGDLEARAAVRGVRRFTTHASITARPFFEGRGYRTVRARQVERHGVLLTNFTMEKDSGA